MTQFGCTLRTVRCATVCGGAVGHPQNVYDTPKNASRSLMKHIQEAPEECFAIHLNEPTDAAFQKAMLFTLPLVKISSSKVVNPIVLYIQCDCTVDQHTCACDNCKRENPTIKKKCQNPGAFYYLPTKNIYYHLRDVLRTQNEENKKPIPVIQKYCANPGCFKTASSVCADCKVVHYCGSDCQKAHWKAAHKALHRKS